MHRTWSELKIKMSECCESTIEVFWICSLLIFHGTLLCKEYEKDGESSFPAKIYLFKVNNRNNRKERMWNMFKANFGHISHIFLVLYCCLCVRLYLRTQPRFKAPCNVWLEKVAMQRWTLYKWACVSIRNPKLPLDQPNGW